MWIDLLSRELVHSGELQRMIDDDAVTGLTSNPSIFQKAIAGGGDYDGQIRESLRETDDPREIFTRLAVDDVRDACDVLRPVWDATRGGDGYVSLEVDPGLAHDERGTVDQAVDLHGRVDRPNLYIKIPGDGRGAVRDRGLHRARHPDQRHADLLGRAVSARGGGIPARALAAHVRRRRPVEGRARWPRSSSRGSTPRRTPGSNGHPELQGKLGIANAKLAYKDFQEIFQGPIWDRMADAGATKQRPLWASTSTKNPAYRDVMYVEELIGPDTVNTMPLETLEAFADHGEVRGDTVLEDVDAAEKLLDDLAAAGVDYDDVVEKLELEGVQKFADAFDELIAGIEARRGELAAT